jgi:hypothetical protein
MQVVVQEDILSLDLKSGDNDFLPVPLEHAFLNHRIQDAH